MDGSEPQPPICEWCGEPILPNEPKKSIEYFCGAKEVFHFECQVRQIIGSLAHIERRCGCFVEGATEGDPPTMTKREAARAALTAYMLKYREEPGAPPKATLP